VYFRQKLLNCSNHVKAQTKVKVDKKTVILREVIDKGGLHDMTTLEDPLPMPSDPSVVCTGIVPSKCSVFKSAVQPMRMTFNCEITTEVEDE